MPIKFNRKSARFAGVCTVEETDALMEWLDQQAEPKVDLGRCEHLHTALVQVLLARQVRLTAAPADPWLAAALAPLLQEDADAGFAPAA